MNDIVLRELAAHASRLSGDFRNHKSPLRHYLLSLSSFFFLFTTYFSTSPYDDVFLRLTSIPARGGDAPRKHASQRRAPKQTSLISQEPLDARIVHDFRFTVTPLSTGPRRLETRPRSVLSAPRSVSMSSPIGIRGRVPSVSLVLPLIFR